MKKNNFAAYLKWLGSIALIVGLSLLVYNIISAFKSGNGIQTVAEKKCTVADKLYYPVIPSNMPDEESMKPSGEFVVSVLNKDKTWSETKRLKYDEFFRTKTLDIGSGKTVKIQKFGGGNAHLDAVLLGNSPALSVSGSNDNPVKKLAVKDADVIDATLNTIIFNFPENESSNHLTITGRIEKAVISKEPFKFPLKNTYFPVTEKSAFYTYKVVPSNTSADLNNVFDNAHQLFKEYCIPGTGHPDAYTFGYVTNDNKNLYVRLDFTGDNTMDSDKDYTKVYIKTEKGIHEFKMSVPENKWGNPKFAYNDKVVYQHKIYDYTIPLSEIKGVNDKLEMVFEAYGTCAPPPDGTWEPTITYSSLTFSSATINVPAFTFGCAAMERGVVYATHPDPVYPDDNYIVGPNIDGSPFTINLSGLNPSTTYYARLYVQASIHYSPAISFTTGAAPVPVSFWSIAIALILIGGFTLYKSRKTQKKTEQA